MTRPERVLRVQAAIFALVVIALEGWAIVAIQPTHASHEPAIRELARIVAEVDAAALAPEDFADSGSDADRARATRAFTAAGASFSALAAVLPRHRGPIEEARQTLAEAEREARAVFEAPPGAERAEALRRFDVEAARTKTTVAHARDKILSGLLAEQRRHVRLLAAAPVAGALLYGAFAYVAVAAYRGERARERASLAARLDAFARHLDAARDRHPAPELPSDPRTDALRASVLSFTESFRRTLANLALERETALFARHVLEALDLASDEAEVTAFLARASESAFPGASFQLLLAEGAKAPLAPRVAGAAAACEPPSTEGCPALRRGGTLTHAQETGAAALARCPRLTERAHRVTCSAVTVRGEALGVLQVTDPEGRDAADGRMNAMAVAASARLSEVRTLAERERQASTDALTGLLNRRALREREAALDADRRGYAVLMADIDHFKRFNDTFGHETGDRCLKLFAQVLRDACREGDLACRLGGEEFALILPGTGARDAVAAAERVRARIREASAAAGVPFTVSIGAAGREGGGASLDAVLAAADQALYRAKNGGRDRVVLWAPEETAKDLAA